jgi:ankyrin repeat protein
MKVFSQEMIVIAQFAAVRFLLEERGVEINQQEGGRGWTPLHHCAYMAHHD